ncbi:MAG: hypothetical protein JST89_00195 [Cyanobacteria bacterium SZAS-4]|nr:hypothetical protein [Cyanobacteria bacterium SZAS-4]
MPLTIEQFEKSSLFLEFGFDCTLNWQGVDIAVEHAKLYVSKIRGMVVSIYSQDNVTITQLRVGGRFPWVNYHESVLPTIKFGQMQVICAYVMGADVLHNDELVHHFIDTFDTQTKKALDAGLEVETVINECKISHLRDSSRLIIGLQTESATDKLL